MSELLLAVLFLMPVSAAASSRPPRSAPVAQLTKRQQWALADRLMREAKAIEWEANNRETIDTDQPRPRLRVFRDGQAMLESIQESALNAAPPKYTERGKQLIRQATGKRAEATVIYRKLRGRKPR
jgi:hypothetical protein